jgi:hypothetical protein
MPTDAATQQFGGCRRRRDDRWRWAVVFQMDDADETMIPSVMANTVRTTNFKVIALWVIADTLALTYPARKMPPSAESGN